MFEGSLVAIVTPFKNGKVDEQAFRALLQFHIENGTNGIVPCGTTGESVTLTHEEHHQVISIAVEMCKDKIPVLAGTGSNSTQEAIEMTQFAEKVGRCARGLAACGLREGDRITINPKDRSISLEAGESEIAGRLSRWKEPEPKYRRGVMGKYAKLVGSASHGAVTS